MLLFEKGVEKTHGEREEQTTNSTYIAPLRKWFDTVAARRSGGDYWTRQTVNLSVSDSTRGPVVQNRANPANELNVLHGFSFSCLKAI